MLAKAKASRLPAEVVSDHTVMGGTPVVRGTRVPADTILAYIKAGRTPAEIFEDYPSLPIDAVDAVRAWADKTLGPDWQGVETPL